MRTATAKRDIVNFYFNLLFSSALFLFFAVLCFLNFAAHYESDSPIPGKYYFLPLISIALTGSCFYYIREYIKKVPTISLTDTAITFNATPFLISDISYIKFTGKRNFLFSDMECTMVVFKNNTAKVYDDMYSNIPELKLALDYLVNHNKYPPVHKIHPNIISEHFYRYKGIFLFSLQGLLYLAMVLFMFYIYYKNHEGKPGITFFIITIALLMTLLFQRVFHYFELNNSYFRIRNHIKFWKNEIYKTEDIKQVTFQSEGRAPYCLIIVFNDYTSKKYFAATLNDGNWKELQRALQQLNINVINKLPI